MEPLRKAITGAVGLACVAVAAAAIAALLAPLGWPFELFAHFRWQLAIAAAALLVGALALRRPWMILLAGAAFVTQGLPVLPASRTAAAAVATDTCSGPTLNVVTANVLFANTDHAALVEWLGRSDADVIALQEVTPEWEAALAPLARRYPHQRVLARPDPYGMALLSRWPLTREAEAVDLAGDGLPSLVGTLVLPGGRELRLMALHTRWPVTRKLQRKRDLALQAAARQVASGAASTVLVGDLNLTPYAPAFARLVRESGMRDALDDVAWRPTWQAEFWPLALPIDHVLVPRDACVLAHGLGPDIGSDHRPLQVTLRLR